MTDTDMFRNTTTDLFFYDGFNIIQHNNSLLNTSESELYRNITDSFADIHTTTIIISDNTEKESAFQDNTRQNYIWEVSKELKNEIVKIQQLYVQTILSCFGIAGNILSICIILRSGIGKTYNILLFFLSLNNIFYLISVNNIMHLLCQYYDLTICMTFTIKDAYFVWGTFILLEVVIAFSNIFTYILPVFIVVERLVGMFLPLRVKMIITPRRMLTSCITGLLACIAYAIAHFANKYEIRVFKYGVNKTIVLPYVREPHPILESFKNHFINNITGIVPILIVIIGSVVMIWKIVRSLEERRVCV